jgi:hypothetical protein
MAGLGSAELAHCEACSVGHCCGVQTGQGLPVKWFGSMITDARYGFACRFFAVVSSSQSLLLHSRVSRSCSVCTCLGQEHLQALLLWRHHAASDLVSLQGYASKHINPPVSLSARHLTGCRGLLRT